jgi:hypothetical protein
MKRLIQKISRKASPSPQSSARRPDESSSAVSSHSKPNDPDPLFLHGRHGLFRLDRPLPLNSNDNDDRFIYNTDIVFIHGLNGDPETSWSHDGVWWPRDLLPHSMPGARIFSYGYPSKIFSRASTADVRDFSKSLLAYLKLQRADDVHTHLIMLSNIKISLIDNRNLAGPSFIFVIAWEGLSSSR